MKTSAEGIAFLERHEGVVLRAYRCPAGVWTIGAGLTAASGVVKPKAGMVITLSAARAMLAEALARNYEPAVAQAMRGDAPPNQHEFDAGVSFHFNTGAIQRASWVRFWRVLDWAEAERRLKQWSKGGGKVLAGLVRRRDEEFRLMRHGDYGAVAQPARPAPVAAGEARLAAPVTAADVPAIRAALVTLGHASADLPGLPAEAVRAFQAAHGLTVDGIVGRATASAIQRVLDARARAVPVAGAATVAGAGAGSGGIDLLTGVPGLDWAALAAAVGGAAWQAWTYRDALAPVVEPWSPRLAAFLRSL